MHLLPKIPAIRFFYKEGTGFSTWPRDHGWLVSWQSKERISGLASKNVGISKSATLLQMVTP